MNGCWNLQHCLYHIRIAESSNILKVFTVYLERRIQFAYTAVGGVQYSDCPPLFCIIYYRDTLCGLLYSDCPPLFCIIYYRDTLCGLLYSECPPLFCIIYYRDTVCGLLYSFIGTGYLLHVIVISGSMRQSTGYLLHVIVISGSIRQSIEIAIAELNFLNSKKSINSFDILLQLCNINHTI